MATYDSYKDSGVKWLGQIPSHWDTGKMREFFSERKQLSQDGSETLLSVSEYSGITPSVNDSGENFSRSASLIGYKKCKSSDLIINIMLAWKRGLGISDYDGIVSPAYCVFVTHNINPHYANYLLRTDLYTAEFKRNSTGIIESRLRMYPDDFKNIICIHPPKREQEAIVAYLDKVTAEIDRAIEAQKKMIDALNERKQIIITRAVTRGLNPDAPLRDSGIDWLGQIPAHWEVMKLGSLGITSNGISNDASYFGEGYPFVSYSDVYKNFSLPDVIRGLAKSSERDQKVFSVKRGDVFFTRTSETVDEIGFSSVCLNTIHQAVFAGFLIRFRPKENIIVPEFSKFYFRASCHRNYFVKEMNLVTRASLSQQLLKGLTVLLPPKSEQISIADFLNSKVKGLDNFIENCKRMISLLQERKQIIINEVVTGKKKVI